MDDGLKPDYVSAFIKNAGIILKKHGHFGQIIKRIEGDRRAHWYYLEDDAMPSDHILEGIRRFKSYQDLEPPAGMLVVYDIERIAIKDAVVGIKTTRKIKTKKDEKDKGNVTFLLTYDPEKHEGLDGEKGRLVVSGSREAAKNDFQHPYFADEIRFKPSKSRKRQIF